MTRPKIHHYVPKFLLRRFADAGTEQLWVFDKQKGNSFRTHFKNVAGESAFYRLGPDDNHYAAEKLLGILEGAAAPIFEQIISSDRVNALTSHQREILAVFLSVQFTRTKAIREQFREFPQRIREAITNADVAAEATARVSAPDYTEEELAKAAVAFM